MVMREWHSRRGSGKRWTLEGFFLFFYKVRCKLTLLSYSWDILLPFPFVCPAIPHYIAFPHLSLTDIAFFTNWRYDPLPAKKSQLASLWGSLYFNGLDWNPQSLRYACVHHKGIKNTSASISVSLTFLWWLLGGLSYLEDYVGWGRGVRASFRFLLWISVFLNVFHIKFFKQSAFKFILLSAFRLIHFYFLVFLFV